MGGAADSEVVAGKGCIILPPRPKQGVLDFFRVLLHPKALEYLSMPTQCCRVSSVSFAYDQEPGDSGSGSFSKTSPRVPRGRF